MISHLQVTGFTSDNENKMQLMKDNVQKELPNVYVFDCQAHHLNKLEETVSPKALLAQVVRVQKFFRSHHRPHVSTICSTYFVSSVTLHCNTVVRLRAAGKTLLCVVYCVVGRVSNRIALQATCPILDATKILQMFEKCSRKLEKYHQKQLKIVVRFFKTLCDLFTMRCTVIESPMNQT